MIIQQLAMAAIAPPNSFILSPSTATVFGFNTSGPVYAGIKYFASGEEFKTGPGGSSSVYDVSRGDWIDRGNISNVWIQWVRSGGTLADWNSEDSGDARLQMSSDHAWRIVRTSIGSFTILGAFNFYDAESGGNLLATTGELTFTAEYDSGV